MDEQILINEIKDARQTAAMCSILVVTELSRESVKAMMEAIDDLENLERIASETNT